MTQTSLSTAQSLQLSVALAQQLAGLRHQQGRFGSAKDYSPDLLAGMRVKSHMAAAALNDDSAHGFSYSRALQQLHDLAGDAALDCAAVCQLHRSLNPEGGQLRRVKRKITRLNGSARQTGTATGDLEASLGQLLADLNHKLDHGLDALIAIPLFSLDFMQLFPFLDGNRRMALLLSRHLLTRKGHPVLEYVDLESEIVAAERAFYQSLDHSTGSNAGPHRWLAFWWVVLMRVYQRFNRQLQQSAISPGRGAKTALVEHFIRQQKTPFLFTDITSALPTISPDQVRVVLRKLRDRGIISASGRGRGANWSLIKP